MSTVTVAGPTNTEPGSGQPVHGRIHLRERVIEKVAREASAVVVGVPRDAVDVDIAQWGGGLAVRVEAKLPIPDLADTDAIRAETPVLERVRAMQSQLAEDIAWLTGREIRRVSFTVTGAIAPERKRVR
jgi:hypothetical protein